MLLNRRVIAVLLALCLCAALANGVIRYRFPPELTLEIDVYEYTDEWLAGVEWENSPRRDCIILSDMEAFFLLSTFYSDVRRNCYSRHKGTFTSGKPINVSYGPWVALSSSKAPAWNSSQPMEAVITPTVDFWGRTLAVDLRFQAHDSQPQCLRIKVPNEQVALVKLDDVSPGVHRALWIHPRIASSAPYSAGFLR